MSRKSIKSTFLFSHHSQSINGATIVRKVVYGIILSFELTNLMEEKLKARTSTRKIQLSCMLDVAFLGFGKQFQLLTFSSLNFIVACQKLAEETA